MKNLIIICLIFGLHQLIDAQALKPDDCKCRLQSFGRIVGGKEAAFVVPWQVSLNIRNYDNTLSHFCGGTIINRRYIMTTAHCVRQFDDMQKLDLLYVRIGIHSLSERLIPQRYVKASNILWDKRYDNGNGASRVGDFALIELERPLDFDYYVQPTCLPSTNDHFDDRVGSLTAIGWGSVRRLIRDDRTGEQSEPILSDVLKEAQFNYVYPTGNDQHLIMVNSVRNGDSACAGDSGGGLLHTKDGITRTVGLTQLVLGYKDGDYTIFCSGEAGFARIGYYRNILESVVGKDYCVY